MGLGGALWGGPVEVLLIEIRGGMDVTLQGGLFVALPVVSWGQFVVHWEQNVVLQLGRAGDLEKALAEVPLVVDLLAVVQRGLNIVLVVALWGAQVEVLLVVVL